jgi:hypothetical protein
VEKSKQNEMEYMRQAEKELWIDTRLTDEEMDFLRDAISEENKENYSSTLAGNISKSELIKDKDNWFFKSALKKLTERMYYRDWDVYYKYHIEKEESPPEFEMYSFWVNYMKQHEFNPIHKHNGLFSFVVFMKIPTHWKEQHALPISVNSNAPSASDFSFVRSERNSEKCVPTNILLCPEDEGRMLFFPASLQHEVYPFYECEEERITISGNIGLYDSNRLKKQEIPVSEYEQKEDLLQMMKQGVQQVEEELKMMKKAEEKEE